MAPIMGILKFKSFLVVSPFADGNYWYLVETLLYDIRNTGNRIIVPKGFVTDFASIPRPIWSILPKWAEYGTASVVHDYLYWTQQCRRKQADRIFLAAMIDSGVSNWKCWTVYLAVRSFGYFSYKANKNLRKQAHIRVMREEDLPHLRDDIDPHVKWKDYRKELTQEAELPDITDICDLDIQM